MERSTRIRDKQPCRPLSTQHAKWVFSSQIGRMDSQWKVGRTRVVNVPFPTSLVKLHPIQSRLTILPLYIYSTNYEQWYEPYKFLALPGPLPRYKMKRVNNDRGKWIMTLVFSNCPDLAMMLCSEFASICQENLISSFLPLISYQILIWKTLKRMKYIM